LKRRLEYAANAERDLSRAIAWQTQPGAGTAARRRLAAIVAAVNALRHHPCLWRREAGLGGVLIVAGHRVVYSVEPDTGRDETAGDVVILRILGPGQID
jgi:plasmid stabilization system protein ParE